jgi:hypothetical protein
MLVGSWQSRANTAAARTPTRPRLAPAGSGARGLRPRVVHSNRRPPACLTEPPLRRLLVPSRIDLHPRPPAMSDAYRAHQQVLVQRTRIGVESTSYETWGYCRRFRTMTQATTTSTRPSTATLATMCRRATSMTLERLRPSRVLDQHHLLDLGRHPRPALVALRLSRLTSQASLVAVSGPMPAPDQTHWVGT